jgi:hypothetical protein
VRGWTHGEDRGWASLLCVFALILLIKTLFLLFDSQPAFFLGDSAAYLHTATIRWIPSDRSFLYGLLTRLIAYRHHSLEALIYLQVLCSAVASWLLCVALVRFLKTKFWIGATFGILCSIEPLQLLMERYVMTEAVANFLFALHFFLLLGYVRRGRWWVLALSQAVAVLLIGIRISFLPEVLLNSILVPLLSPSAVVFYRSLAGRLRRGEFRVDFAPLRRVAGHLLLCLLVSQGLLFKYKQWYGQLVHREPALFYENGAFLIADLAPIITLQDFPAGSRVDAVMKRVTIDRKDRLSQHFQDGELWHAIQAEYPNPKQANDLAVSTALHALLRDPIGAMGLALETFGSYFDAKRLRVELQADEGILNGELSPKLKDLLRTLYGVSCPQSYTLTLTKRWHLFALPWYWLVLCSLAASPLLALVVTKENFPVAVLTAVTALVLLEGVTFTVDHPTPRYLTTAAWLVLLMLGIGLQVVTPLAAGHSMKQQVGVRSKSSYDVE